MRYRSCFLLLAGVTFCARLYAQQPGNTVWLKLDTATLVLGDVTITSKYYHNYKLDNSSGSLKVNSGCCSFKFANNY